MTNKKYFRLLLPLLFVSILFTQNALASNALPEFNARYAIEKFGIKLAEAQYQLSYTDKGYKFTQDTRLHGIASMFASDSVSAVSYVDVIGENTATYRPVEKKTGMKISIYCGIHIRTRSREKSPVLSGVKRSTCEPSVRSGTHCPFRYH